MIPRKFQPKTIKNEPIEETEVRKSLAKVALNTEVNLCKIRYERKQKEVDEIDKEMKSLIVNESTEPMIQRKLLQQWNADTVEEEKTSAIIFLRKEEWFKENWTNELKVNKQKQENKTIRDNNIQHRNHQKVRKKKRWKHREKKYSKNVM